MKSIVDKQEALRILEKIEENINVCCAITMEPDEVLALIDKLRKILENK
jgi:PII-like signaling protein